MPTFDSQRLWPAVVAVGVLGIGGFVYAAIGYVERTSDAAFAEFLVATWPAYYLLLKGHALGVIFREPEASSKIHGVRNRSYSEA